MKFFLTIKGPLSKVRYKNPSSTANITDTQLPSKKYKELLQINKKMTTHSKRKKNTE